MARLAQIENAGHLIRIFLDHADAMLANRALQPALPYRRNQELGKNIFPRQLKDGAGMQRSIADC